MFGCELRKIIKSSFFRLSLLLLFILLGILVYFKCIRGGADYSEERFYFELTDGRNGLNSDAEEYYKQLSANLDVPFLQAQEGKYSSTAFGDYYLLGEIREQAAYVQNGYPEDMRAVVEKAYKDLLGEKSVYGRKNYAKIIKIYNSVVETEIIPQKSTENFLYSFHGEGSVLFCMVAVLWVTVLTAYVIGTEESKALVTVVRSTAGGRRRLLAAKLLSAAALTAAVMLVLTLAEFLIGRIIYKIDWRSLGASVQSLSKYKMCDTKISIFGMLLLLNFAKLIFLLAVAATAAALAVFVKSVPAAGITAVIYEAQLFLIMNMDKSGYMADLRFMRLRQYNPVGLVWGSSYMKSYDYARLIGVPVKVLYECMTVAAVFTALLVTAAIIKSEYVNRRKNGNSYN
ncbi:MAG: hypothetical protein NC223_11060 [Butyrivibrio sp.]|nr:hypothetical protein [Butyrivibrio sp.]